MDKNTDVFSTFKEFEENLAKQSKEKVANILKEEPKLSTREIKSLIEDINRISRFSKENQNIFDKIIKIYDSSIDNKNKFQILLNINHPDTFREYAEKHHDLFKDFFKKTIFVNPLHAGELDELEDFQWKLNIKYPEKNYKAEWSTFETNCLVELYEYFGEYIKFLFGDKFFKYDLSYINILEADKLDKLFSQDLSSPTKDINTFLKIYSSKFERNEYDIHRLQKFFSSKKNIEELLEIFVNYYNNVSDVDNYQFIDMEYGSRNFYSNLYNEVLRNNLKDIDNIDEEKLNNFFDINYLKALNKLSTIPRTNLSSNPLYLKCFKTFLELFLRNYKDPINLEKIEIIDILFRRVINKKSVFEILTIKDDRNLYFFYKTDECLQDIPLTVEQIKKIKVKQYFSLKAIYHRKSEKLYIEDNDKESKFLLEALQTLGYDYAKKLFYLMPHQVSIIVEHIKSKEITYIEAIKRVITADLKKILNNKYYDLSHFLSCFDFLFEQNCENITLSRVLKCMNSVSYALLPSNYNIEADLEKLNLVAKGTPLLEKIEGIKLYDRYRFRINSSIPDISGEYGNYNYSMVNMHSPEILSNGIGKYVLPNNVRASSCLTPNGKAASCLEHGALNPNGRFFKVTNSKDQIIAYSWVWRAGDVLCFDNIEVTNQLLEDETYESILYGIYKKVANDLIERTKKAENRGIKLVVLGRNKIDLANEYFDNLPRINKEEQELYKPNSSTNLYLADSSETQLILAGNNENTLITKDVEPIYQYQRPQIKRFKTVPKEELEKELNSIYFDYCLQNNQKYQKLVPNYLDGYLTDDWFIGIRKDQSREFYYRGNDDRLFTEAGKYLESIQKITISKPNIISPKKDEVSRILNRENITFDLDSIKKYLGNSNRKFVLSNNYYSHNPGTLSNFANILENNAITSVAYGNHDGGGGCNGKYFISVAKVNSKAFENYLASPTFIISDDICAFSSMKHNQAVISGLETFKDTAYPYRIPYHEGEYHVLNHINLDKTEGIYVKKDSVAEIIRLIQIVYLQELFENHLPLIDITDNSYINSKAIKRYSKIKK